MASTVLPNGIIIPEKYSRDWYADLYHNWQELDNLLGGGTPKDGTLTIQKNGSTVGTFSANQATDETINLSVPTKTSDLTNDSGFITEDTSKIPLSGTNALAGSIIPSTDNTYDFGSSTYKIRYVYAGTIDVTNLNINGTAAGDILTHNANEFVDVTSAQTIGGKKIFSDAQMGVGKDVYHFAQVSYGVNTPPASTSYQYIFFSGNTASQGFTNSWYSGFIEQIVNTDGSARGRWQIRRTDETIASVEILAGADNTLTFRPTYDNQMQLGDSTHAWKDCKTKAINGINPGALSLPSSSYINLDTTDFDTTSTIIGTFRPTVDGWVILNISQKNKHFGIWIIGGTYRATFHSIINSDVYFIFALMPVRANVTMTIYCAANDIDSTRAISWLRFFPCHGNV